MLNVGIEGTVYENSCWREIHHHFGAAVDKLLGNKLKTQFC
jgi:hypothetical protein